MPPGAKQPKTFQFPQRTFGVKKKIKIKKKKIEINKVIKEKEVAFLIYLPI